MKQDLEEEMKKNIRTTREMKRRERTASISHGRQTTHTTGQQRKVVLEQQETGEKTVTDGKRVRDFSSTNAF